MKNKVLKVIKELEDRLIEREVSIRISILAIFCKEHVFMIGERGVAKSYMIKLFSNIVEDFKYWELQVGSDTTVEQLLGEKRIDEDGNVYYASDKSMLSSDLAFLDEMFKAKTEVLNAILQLLVDRYYTTGDGKQIHVDLNSVFGASNEFPTSHDALAYVDRFLFWLEISRIRKRENRLRYFAGDYNQEPIEKPLITKDDIDFAVEESKKIFFSEELLQYFEAITENLIKYEVKTSDRKYKAITKAIKMSAFLNGRSYIDFSDLFIFLYTAWHNFTEKVNAREVVYNTVFKSQEIVNNELERIKTRVNEVETFIKANLFDYLNYNKSFIGDEKERFFNLVKDNTKAAIDILQEEEDRLFSIYELHQFVVNVEEQIENNIFLPNYKNETFNETNLKSLDELYDITKRNINHLSKWAQNNITLADYNTNRNSRDAKNGL